jgi:hypothetical protein
LDFDPHSLQREFRRLCDERAKRSRLRLEILRLKHSHSQTTEPQQPRHGKSLPHGKAPGRP